MVAFSSADATAGHVEGRPAGRGRPSRIYLYFISFVAAVGGFLFGYDLSIISGAEIFLKNHFHLGESQLGFAVSIALLGCMAGPVLGAWLCDAIGRKKVLMIAAVLFGASAVGTALPETIGQFNLFRIVCGVGIGLASVASPMYIAEIAPAHIRGRLVTMNQLAIVVGSLSAFIASFFLARHLPESYSWRWMFATAMVPSLVLLVALFPLADTPRWLLSRSRRDEALAVLDRIHGREEAAGELQRIEESLGEESGSYAELFQPGIRVALAVGTFVALMAMWTGWTVISFYLPMIFEKANPGHATDALFRSILVNCANLVFTVVGLFLMDVLGRRTMWLGGSLAMALGTFLLGLVFFTGATGWKVAVAVCLCAAPHAVVLGPLCWLIISEIFPTRIRARAVSLSTLVVWAAGFASNWAARWRTSPSSGFHAQRP